MIYVCQHLFSDFSFFFLLLRILPQEQNHSLPEEHAGTGKANEDADPAALIRFLLEKEPCGKRGHDNAAAGNDGIEHGCRKPLRRPSTMPTA